MFELPTQYQQFIHLSRYARWLPEQGRRETWKETVNRYLNFMEEKFGEKLTDHIPRLRQAILGLDVLPSMRALMTAGPALERQNLAQFNCSFVIIDHPHVFDEILYALLCGCGVGFSVERQYICKLPIIAENFRRSNSVIVVEDSKEGWGDAYRELISALYSGVIPKWNLDKIRPAGSRLRTFGGRASGPEPLEDLFRFTCNLFQEAAGRKLNSIECHDLACKVAEAVVVGGVRRSSGISLSNPSDDRMRHAKSGEWWKERPYRSLANISAAYTEKPGMDVFIREWLALYESKSGERGFFNREAAKRKCLTNGRREPDDDFGLNPCGETILKSAQLCNLSEVIVRADDNEDTLKGKVVLATILGTIQASLTNFPYLRGIWRKNTEEEALLGVSLTGVMDNSLMSGSQSVDELREVLGDLRLLAIETNVEWAEILGINPAAAVTLQKPSGSVSQLANCSSGIHPRFSPYYIRRVRADKNDPLAKMMQDMGFPCEPDVMNPSHNLVFSFPQKSPEGAICRKDTTAVQCLDLWKAYCDCWCEHNSSVTIQVREHEWLDVGAWLYRQFDSVVGATFLPYSNHNYRQAPYEECTEEEHNEMVASQPKECDWSKLSEYEDDDETVGGQTLACSGDSCELVDLTR